MASDDNRRIRLVLEGVANEDGHVLLADLLRELGLLRGALRRLDERISGTPGGATYYRVVGLSHSSPAAVWLEGHSLSADNDFTVAVLDAYVETVADIEVGRIPDTVDVPFLRSIKDMAAPVGKTLKALRVERNGTNIEFTSRLRKSVEEILAPEEIAPGWLRGMLEALNIHGPKNIFYIYPDYGPKKVRCIFPEALFETAKDGIGRFVEVKGTLRYKVASDYPHEVTVDTLEVMPAEDDLPTLFDIRGIAPNFEPNDAADEYVKALDDAATH